MKRILTLALCGAVFLTSVAFSKSYAVDQQYSENLIPVMTSNEGANGVVPFSSGENLVGYGYTYKAFDGSTGPVGGQGNHWESNSGNGTGVIGVKFPSAMQVTKMTITAGYDYYGCKTWNVEASDNGVSWDVLGTFEKTSWTPTDVYTMELNNDKKYTQYRLNILSSTARTPNCLVGELQMFSPLTPPVVVDPTNPTDDSTKKAIIEITLNNGKIKEYEVTAAELAKYQYWFDRASEGTGKKYYTFVKTVLVKPFVTRKETIQFKDIETFEVKEY